MKKIFATVFSFFTLVTFAQDTPSADIIIEKYLTAIGGKEAIAKIQDLTISSISETSRGTSETELKFKFPDRYSMSIYSGGNEIMSAIYDGNKLKNGGFMGGNRPAMEGKDAQIAAMRSNPFPEILYDKIGISRTVIGKDKVGDKETYKLELSTTDGKKWNDYYDIASGLKVKTYSMSETPRGKIENNISYLNYKKFKGVDILFPSQTKRFGGQMGEIVSEVQSIKVNKGLKDSDFVIKD